MTSAERPRKKKEPVGIESLPVGARVDLENVRHVLPALFDALADAVLVIDRDRRVVAANRLYLETFGNRRVDVVGSACTEALHCPEAGDADRERCVACDVIDRRSPQRRIRQLADGTGTMRRYEATFSPIVGAGGTVTHVMEVWRDITDRSRLEVQLSHSERLASVGILAAGVAHEINNPLASILAGVEGLARWVKRGRFDAEAVSEAVETLGMLDGEIERCRETTEKLMLLSRSYDTSPRWVDLNRAVRDTLALLGYELRKRSIEAVEDLDSELPQIWAREAGVRGICMNILINAVQAMSGSGRLAVTTRREGDQVRLMVEDSGPGIAPEHIERIWEPFFTTKPLGQGTGLGLSITNRIVTRHGGRITVESEAGRGARFVVDLPVHGTGGDE